MSRNGAHVQEDIRAVLLRAEANEIARAMVGLAYFIGRVEERRRLRAPKGTTYSATKGSKS